MSECRPGKTHDFSDQYSDYCANGCGEKWSLYTIKQQQKEIEQLKKENFRLNAFFQEFIWGEDNPSEYETQSTKIERLKKQVEILRTACEFYADKESWELSGSLTNMREFRKLKSYGKPLADLEDFFVPNTFGYAHENKELKYKIAGKFARQALKDAEGV